MFSKIKAALGDVKSNVATRKTQRSVPMSPSSLELSHTARHANLIVTYDGLYAAFVLKGINLYSMSPDDQHANVLALGERIAETTGHTVEMYGVPNPQNIDAFIDANRATVPVRNNPDGTPTNIELSYLQSLELQRAYLEEKQPRSTEIVYMVHLSHTRYDLHDLPYIRSYESAPDRMGGIEETRREYHRIVQIMGRPGFDAVPLPDRALLWMIVSTMRFGLDVPTANIKPIRRDGSDEAMSAEAARQMNIECSQVEAYRPNADEGSIRIVAVDGATPKTSRVVVMRAVDILERGNPDLSTVEDSGLDAKRPPWWYWCHTRPYPVMTYARWETMLAGDMEKDMQVQERKMIGLSDEYIYYDDKPTKRVKDASERASEAFDEVQGKSAPHGNRVKGVFMAAIAAPTDHEVVSLASDFMSEAASANGPGIEFMVPRHGMFDDWKSMIPGEPTHMDLAVMEMPMQMLAAGVPNLDPYVGTARGRVLGPIHGSTQIAFFDCMAGSENNVSGTLGFLGDQGSGKSSTIAMFAKDTAERGFPTIVTDNRGYLKRLAEIPQLRDNSRIMEVTSAEPGSFMPSILVLDPERVDYPANEMGERQYVVDLAAAKAERIGLMTDSLIDCLPPEAVEKDTRLIVRDAANEFDYYGANPWDVTDRIRKNGHKALSEYIESYHKQKGGALIFTDKNKEVDDTKVERQLLNYNLLVITIDGIAVPPGNKPLIEWTSEELASRPITRMLPHFLARSLYSKQRTATFMDEILGTLHSGSMRYFFDSASTNTRKTKSCIGFGTQAGNHMKMISPDIANALGATFVFRTRTESIASALDVASIPVESGYGTLLPMLPPGDVILRDFENRFGHVSIDKSCWPQELDMGTITHLITEKFDTGNIFREVM